MRHFFCDFYFALCNALDKLIPKRSIPKFLFDMVFLMHLHIKYKLNKLLGDEYYSYKKLEKLGLKLKKNIKGYE